MKKIVFIIVLFSTSLQLLTAQNLRKANHLFLKRAYVEAAKLYLKEDPKNQEVLEKLGDCYYYNSEMKDAVNWYEQLFTNYENEISPEYYLKYAEALKGIGDFTKADALQKKYDTKENISAPTESTQAYIQQINQSIKRPFIIHSINGNSKGSDFGVSYYEKNNVVFASTRGIEKLSSWNDNNKIKIFLNKSLGKGKLYSWNEQPYLNLYTATIDSVGGFKNIVPFSNTINTKLHESNAVFTNDGLTMYFTRNNYLNGKKGKDSNKVTNLKIYKASLINGEWTNVTELPFDNDNYSVEHPALSPDNKTIYFASDMPGSIGSFDLYSVAINTDGTYGTPVNLGNKINTELREQFPFISEDGSLYFASDGHQGLGGLDIFKSTFTNGKFSEPINLGSGINSSLDDFGFVINDAKETGYFSSNRLGGKGDDDIYAFTITPKLFVTGIVQDKNSHEILPQTTITLFDATNTQIGNTIVGDDGKYSFEIYPNSAYKIKGSKDLYIPSEVSFTTDKNGNIDKDILLTLESYKDAEKTIAEEQGKLQIKIDPIYFDINKWNIRKDAALVLDNVVSIMKKYPEMKIEVGAHTDYRGKDSYNLKLSDKRAKSVKDYLVSQGVSEENISTKGYGETQPVNNCTKPGICSEADVSLNRRCEFVIVQ